MPNRRIENLQYVLTETRLRAAWKSVRPGMRRQALVDLHDYLDVHRSMDALVDRLRRDVALGSYRPRESEIITLEKRLGIPRRLVVPSAVDAIVLQALVDYIAPRLLSAAPTDRAYWGRSHQPPNVEDVDDSYPYAWWKLWPEFQEKIWQFAQVFDWVVMTDVANYFDSIPLGRLRNKITALGLFEEEVLDLLFFLIESLVWRPQYVPSSGVGLPQIDFDAPRLLAHAFLFEVDDLLDRHTRGSFVRWMDDIDFGVPSRAVGKRLLGQLDTLMATHGVRLNAGKSRILSGKEALEHLWVNENRRLTLLGRLLTNSVSHSASAKRIGDYAFRHFKAFYRGSRHGVWGKILKRYLTLFTRTRHAAAVRWMPEVLSDEADVRAWVFKYFAALGYSPKRFRIIETFLLSDDCADDISLFGASKLLVDWSVPRSSMYVDRAASLSGRLVARLNGSVPSFAAGLWLSAKYARPNALASYLQNTSWIWRRSEFASRQAAAVLPLLHTDDADRVETTIRRSGLLDGLGVLASIRAMQALPQPDGQLRPYLLHPGSFGLPKFVVASAILGGPLAQSAKAHLRGDLSPIVDDPIYRYRLAVK